MALFVLTAGLLGIMSLLSQSLALNKITSDQIKAAYLAEEGLELAKNLVDHDIYQSLDGGNGWGKSGPDPTFPSTGKNYAFDYLTCTTVHGHGNNCPNLPGFDARQPLRYDPATNMYSYSGSVVTSFTRNIHVLVSNNQEVGVQSIVTWPTGPVTTQSITLEDYFYNWHP